jgi:hypothetical protein
MKRRKTGGRKKGTPNKPKTDRVEMAASGMLPLDYMLSVMRDPKASDERRDAMAARAAPYCHARCQTVELTDQGARPEVNGPTQINIHFVEPNQPLPIGSLPPPAHPI